MTAHFPPQALRISHRGERETRVTRASDWRRSAMDHGKDEEARRSDFSSVFSFPPSQRPYIVVSCKLISFSRWLEGIRNQSPQSVGAARCSTSDWGQERHEICYERYFCQLRLVEGISPLLWRCCSKWDKLLHKPFKGICTLLVILVSCYCA